MHEISSEEVKPENVPLEFSIFKFAYERTFIARITTLIERSEQKSIEKTNSLRSFVLFAFSGEFFSSTASFNLFGHFPPQAIRPKRYRVRSFDFFFLLGMNSIRCQHQGFQEVYR